ncbi:PREDICTED: metalloendoproteinase 2-MMP-like [Ipomoea nil]|uniref:metalloendoproteinase 2-MMP-like n=1 Tax=Ipomoea nil TaxID=35883 RepID=UPI000901CF45|nr:PREDICTED: metalloendoproteinase 2-MMP-like [Ipomoea nil]
MSLKASPLLSCVCLLLVLFPSHAEPPTAPAAGEKPPSAFEFIKRLQGCRKGDNVEGLKHLKNYLKRFGYLDDFFTINGEEENDGFDDFLESAVKTYQSNHRLNATGVLDAETVSLMATPRCGVADIVNGQNLMQRRRRRLGSFHAVSRYVFFDGELRWPDGVSLLTYGFAPGTPPEFSPQVAMAFTEWTAKSHFSFAETDYANADLKIALFVGDHGDGLPFDGPSGVLAHAKAPTGGTFHIDADEAWSADPSQDQYDIQSVALHEIGHLLGLAHSTVPESVMWPSINVGVKHRVLHEDDVQGIRALYSQPA